MTALDQFKLTQEELTTLYFKAQENAELTERRIADAATEKALRGVVAWLRERSAQLDNIWEAARELDTMLTKEQPRG